MIRNILICTTQVPFTTGGAEAHVAGLKQAFETAGYNAEIVALPFRWYPPVEIMRSTLMWRLLNVAESNGQPVDLVIGMKFPAYTIAHSRKVLWIIHQHRSAYNLWDTQFDDLSNHPEGVQVRDFIHRCDRKFLPEAKKIFANSATVAGRLKRFNAIDSEPLYHPPPRADSLQAHELGDFIFYPSRLEPQKRQELLIEAMHYVTSPVRCILAGSSSNRAAYQSLIKRHDVSDRIELLDFVDEQTMIELYAGALGVCYLPFDEDYGYVTLEAMISARPVIVTTDSGGPTEFVEDQINGFIVEPDPKQIAAAIDRLHNNRVRSRTMGRRGQEKVKGMNLSWSNVVETLITAAS